MAALHGRRIKTRHERQPRDKLSARYRPLLIGVKLPAPITEEVLKQLLSKVRKNNREAIEEVILAHVRLAISIVSRYVEVYRLNHYADILDSAALEAIVTAVNRVAEGKMANHDNLTGYIVKYIHQYVAKAIDHSSTVVTPRRKQNKQLERLPDTLSERDSQLDIQEFEAWDLVENLTNDKVEREILKLKREGYTDTEIGKTVGLPRLKVCRTRLKLFNRYRKGL